MRDRLIGIICAILLGALASFYGVESYRSSFAPHYQQRGSHAKSGTSEPTNESVQDISAKTVAYYTEVLAWFTGILATASIIQGWMLIRADATLKDHAAQLKRTSDFTETQNAIISAQTDIQQKQHAIGRLQFLATHRPRLIVRHVTIIDDFLGIPMGSSLMVRKSAADWPS